MDSGDRQHAWTIVLIAVCMVLLGAASLLASDLGLGWLMLPLGLILLLALILGGVLWFRRRRSSGS